MKESPESTDTGEWAARPPQGRVEGAHGVWSFVGPLSLGPPSRPLGLLTHLHPLPLMASLCHALASGWGASPCIPFLRVPLCSAHGCFGALPLSPLHPSRLSRAQHSIL